MSKEPAVLREMTDAMIGAMALEVLKAMAPGGTLVLLAIPEEYDFGKVGHADVVGVPIRALNRIREVLGVAESKGDLVIEVGPSYTAPEPGEA